MKFKRRSKLLTQIAKSINNGRQRSTCYDFSCSHSRVFGEVFYSVNEAHALTKEEDASKCLILSIQ